MAYRVYKNVDYEGAFNLLLAEKGLIIQAYTKFDGNKVKMARALRITLRSLYDRIAAHKLDNILIDDPELLDT
jgi:DNA-binding NtrC family response regulator